MYTLFCRVGDKTEKDISICLKTFQGITKEQWVSMCGIQGNIIEIGLVPKTLEELRNA